MRFKWDEAKNCRNLTKQGIAFKIARCVFEDLHALSIQDRNVEGEERWQTLGAIGDVVAHTHEEWETKR